GEMICHGSAGRFHHAIGSDAVMRSDRLLQRRVAIAVGAIEFEFLQINRQLAKKKWRHAARCEIEPRAALRLGPMHVIGMLVSHELSSVTRRSTAIPAVGPAGILPAEDKLNQGGTPGCPTGKMPVLRSASESAPKIINW